MKHVAVRGPQLPQSSVWDIFDQVIYESQTPTVDTPLSDSVEANHASVMKMVHAYVAELMIDRISEPLKWWAANGIKKTVLVPTTN